MIQPSCEMENGHNMNATPTDGSLMTPLDHREHARSPHDITASRLKNRERQRRYRARKRQEADMKKACIVNPSTYPHVEIQATGFPADFVSRIHCQRDWKKDARRAHTFQEQEVTPNCLAIPDSTLASGSQAPSFPSGVNAPSQLLTEFHSMGSLAVDNAEAHLSTPSRRNWKAEARHKKN